MAEASAGDALTIIGAVMGILGGIMAILTFVWNRIGTYAAWKKEVMQELRQHHDRISHLEWMCKPISDLTEQRLIETVKRQQSRRRGGDA